MLNFFHFFFKGLTSVQPDKTIGGFFIFLGCVFFRIIFSFFDIFIFFKINPKRLIILLFEELISFYFFPFW